MPFFFKCLITHILLLVFFWSASWYTANVMYLVPSWGQTLIGIVYLSLLFISFYRIDLISLRRRSENGAAAFVPMSTGHFYARVAGYYVVILGVPSYMLFNKESIPAFLLAYVAFVWLAILINHVDYAFPSYARYSRLAAGGKWGRMLGASDGHR